MRKLLYILLFSFYTFTNADVILMAQLLCGSGRIDGDGEYDIDFMAKYSEDQVSLVLDTVMNRVNSKLFPNTIKEVILQKGQFAVMPRNTRCIISRKAYMVVKEWCYNYSKTGVSSHDKLYFYGDGYRNHTK